MICGSGGVRCSFASGQWDGPEGVPLSACRGAEACTPAGEQENAAEEMGMPDAALGPATTLADGLRQPRLGLGEPR